MGYLSKALEETNSIKISIGEIKNACNDKGAQITDKDKLTDWANRISSNISAGGKVNLKSQFTGVGKNWCLIPPSGPAIFEGVVKMTVPSYDYEGNPVGRTINLNEKQLNAVGSQCNNLIIPQYFTNVKLKGIYKNDLIYSDHCCLDYEGSGILELDNSGNNPSFPFNLIICKGTFKGPMSCGTGIPEGSLSIPNQTELTTQLVSGGPLTLNINAPLLRKISNYNVCAFAYVRGDITLPACESIDYFGLGSSSNNPEGAALPTLTLRLPAIKNITRFVSSECGYGQKHVYLGPSLSSVPSTGFSGAHLTFHIPAGESVTKATLDASGIPYIQDNVTGV